MNWIILIVMIIGFAWLAWRQQDLANGIGELHQELRNDLRTVKRQTR
jgi:hypothetical protein